MLGLKLIHVSKMGYRWPENYVVEVSIDIVVLYAYVYFHCHWLHIIAITSTAIDQY